MENRKLTSDKFIVIILYFLGFALANFSRTSFILFKMRLTPAIAVSEGVLRLSGNIILASAIMYSIVYTIRQDKDNDLSVKHKIEAISLVIVALALSVSSFRMTTAFNDYDKLVGQTNTEVRHKFLNKLNKSTNAAQKSKLTHLYAQIIYEEEGKIIQYITPEGKSISYRPTPDSEKNREKLSFFNTYKRMNAPISASAGMIWLVTAFVGSSMTFRRIYAAKKQPVQNED